MVGCYTRNQVAAAAAHRVIQCAAAQSTGLFNCRARGDAAGDEAVAASVAQPSMAPSRCTTTVRSNCVIGDLRAEHQPGRRLRRNSERDNDMNCAAYQTAQVWHPDQKPTTVPLLEWEI